MEKRPLGVKAYVPPRYKLNRQKVTIKLFREFLIKNGIKLDYLYYRSRTIDNLIKDNSPRDISDLFIIFSVGSGMSLTLSQLWRFYVYEHLFLYKVDVRQTLKDILKASIRNNGMREDKRLKRLFAKHKIGGYHRREQNNINGHN